MVDPDDPDRHEGNRVGGVARPLGGESAGEVLARSRFGNVDLQHQQRDRYSEDPVGEGLDPVGAHDKGFGTLETAPVAGRTLPVSTSRLFPMASPEAKNLETISRAIDQHNSNCPFPAAEVRMNPFEVERLGWEQIRGLPVVPDAENGTGRLRIVCSRDLLGEPLEEVEAIGQELQTVAPVDN